MALTSATIVGAGPAGLIAAEILAREGVEVSVVDKDTHPGEKKPCAGMLRAAAVKRFGIPPRLASRQITGMRVVLPNHTVVEEDYGYPVFFNFDRGVLGQYLLNRVRKLGAKVATGTRVVDVMAYGKGTSKGGYELTCQDTTGANSRVEADLLIGADGVNSTVVKKTRVHEPFKSTHLGQCVQYQIQLSNHLIEKRIGDRNEVYYGSDVSPFGYAWIVPKDDTVIVGVGALLSSVESNLRNYLDYLVTKHSVASGKLGGGKILRFEAALCPLSGLVSPTYDERMVVAGDAAGHCSSISGEGMYYSMVAGAAAGVVCSKAATNEDLSARFLRRYEYEWRKAIGSDLRWGKWLQRIALSRGLMSGAFHRETKLSNSLTKRVVDILAGVKPYRESILKAIPGFLIARLLRTASSSQEN